MSRSKTIALIPARLESSRLPRKALVDILGLPMIVHVYKRCKMAKTLDDVAVATDSQEIADVARAHDVRVIMTSSHHQTGTDRIAEAAEKLDFDIVVNVQGDEALVKPEHIDAAVMALKNDPEIPVSILVNPYNKQNSPSDIKAVLNNKDEVMYFSRSDIPSSSRTPNAQMLKAYHIVPFRKDFLMSYASWEKGVLEQIDFNEYLRILERGHKIKAIRVESSAVSVDTIADLDFVREQMRTDALFNRYKP